MAREHMRDISLQTTMDLEWMTKLKAKLDDLDNNADNPPLATTSTPGVMPHFPLTPAEAGVDSLTSASVPAFSAGAATISPAVGKTSAYNVESTRTLSVPCALTVATTSMPARGQDIFITCKALALGQIMTIVNGGPAGGNLGTFAASLTTPEIMRLWWDGTNFIFNGQDWINP